MKPIRKYVECQLDIFRKECNFSDEELDYFNMKAKDFSDVKIADRMDISVSKVANLSRQVRDKMKTVYELGLFS